MLSEDRNIGNQPVTLFFMFLNTCVLIFRESAHMKVYIEKLNQGGGSHLGGDLETTRHHGTLIFTEMREDTHIFHLKKTRGR